MAERLLEIPAYLPASFPKKRTLRERGAKGKFVVQRGLTEAIFLPKRKKSDFPKKYTLLDNIDAVFPKISGFPIKGAGWHPASSGGLQAGDAAIEPEVAVFQKVVRQGFDLTTKTHATLFGCGNALGLPVADVLAFVLSHEGKHLQDKISDERAEQVFVASGVE